MMLCNHFHEAKEIMSLECHIIDENTRVSHFDSGSGAGEFHATFNSPESGGCSENLDKLFDRYREVIEQFGLSGETLAASRFYLCDVVNEYDVLRHSEIFREMRKGACSVIQQCPIQGGRVGLLVYHIKCPGKPFRKEQISYEDDEYRNATIIHGRHYQLVWTTNFAGNGSFDAYKQTKEVFNSYCTFLKQCGMSLLQNGIRTWVYVRDLDNHYRGMAEARKELFEQENLTPLTRYLASTGIGGVSRDVRSIVSLDAYSINNIMPEQIVRMEAPGYLCPTITYGATFERGLRIRFGDRSHLIISGTASIDDQGRVAHPGDVRQQTRRTLRNIRALLDNQSAGFADLAYIIVYLRSFKDEHKVMDIISEEFPPNLPFLLVEGPVCRPEWLIEIEGVGIIPDETGFPPFC